ncbi:MAG: penicillin acylase family protein, partial [Calditrichia bacterium]
LMWDSSGVIHIQAENEDDLLFASGYAVARERLFQMELMRRVGKGRLSEVFGDTTIKIDKLFLTLGIDSVVKQVYPELSATSRNWLEQYSAGVNAYLQKTGGDLPMEFIVLGIDPEPWTPQDCLLQHRIMTWFLNFNWKADLVYWLIHEQVPQEKFKEIWPDWTKYPTILKPGKIGELYRRMLEIDRQVRDLAGLPDGHWGSNSWVISPQKSSSGKALLANDPHLALQLPPIWIEMHLQCPKINVAGFALPGSPGIIIGRNEKISWGLTNGMVDDCDYFIEEADTTEKSYVVDGEQRKLDAHNVYLGIKGETDRILTVYRTGHGPVFNHIFPDLQLSRYLSLQWIGFEFSDELLTFARLAKAENYDDFREALRSYRMPAQNFVYADRFGTIGYRLGGSVPLRTYKTGFLPVSGSDPGNRWRGYVDFDKMPEIVNPERQWIVTANNRVTADNGYYISQFWEPPYRAMRIEELLNQYSKIGVEEIRQIQKDVKNLLAEETLPVILPVLESSVRSRRDEDMILLLKNWDYRMVEEAVAPSLFEVLQYKLIRNIFQDEMEKDLFTIFVNLPNFYLKIFSQVLLQPNSQWFDNVNSPEREGRSEIILKSFRQTMNFLKDSVDSRPENWRWGQLHQLELMHAMGQVPILKQLFNKGPFPVPGSGTTINVAAYQYAHPFKMIAGPSMRFVVDWSARESYLSILPGGNSGNFLGRYYDNQIEAWRSGELKKVELYKVKSAKQMILSPGK